MADTWGIPGPVFLAWYAVAAAVVLVTTLVLRSRAFAGPDQVRVDQLSPQHLAYLNGGPALAVYSSLAFLRQHHVLETYDAGRLRRVGGLPPGASALDAAVLHAAGNGVQSSSLRTDRSVAQALDSIDADLQRGGLTVQPEMVARARRGPLLLLALAVLGAVRVFAGIANNRPVGFLVVLVGAVVLVSLVLLGRRPRRTRAAERALADARRHHAHLRPQLKPAFSTYGPASTALAVGLFGAAVLWAADPAFAGDAGFPEEERHLGGGSSGWSDGGSSSGGDGGSSGGDGGGSSCGGGGGCGGGGCGG
ncbi:TIGR04222 domain-containing membrane protein [Catellatospora sp. NPDC049609]|uniref:TIGR04222 domain-containing membrane protein n=1 Tax=Catellatospora sp. NPDC049609 TaxID=3155505 RepID=UPI00343A3181